MIPLEANIVFVGRRVCILCMSPRILCFRTKFKMKQAMGRMVAVLSLSPSCHHHLCHLPLPCLPSVPPSVVFANMYLLTWCVHTASSVFLWFMCWGWKYCILGLLLSPNPKLKEQASSSFLTHLVYLFFLFFACLLSILVSVPKSKQMTWEYCGPNFHLSLLFFLLRTGIWMFSWQETQRRLCVTETLEDLMDTNRAPNTNQLESGQSWTKGNFRH